MIQQGMGLGTPILCTVRLDTGPPLSLADLVQARLANAPDVEIGAICASYADSAAVRHGPWTAFSTSLGGTVLHDYWLVEGFAARLPLGAALGLASASGVVRIELDEAKPGDWVPASDESTVLIGARDAHRLRTSSGQPIRGQGVRIAFADSGIDLRTDQPFPATGGGCPIPPTVLTCSVCCWVDPTTGGVDWPHGAFTRGGVGPGGIPNLQPHRILDAIDFFDESMIYTGIPPMPPVCPQLAPWVSSPEDINWRCGSLDGVSFGHGTAVAAIAAGRRYPHTVMGVTQWDGWDGVAPEATIHSYKIVDDMTASLSPDAPKIAALQRALATNCDVFNLAYQGDWDPLGTLNLAIDNAALADLVVCASASNCGPPVNTCLFWMAGEPFVRQAFLNGFIVGAASKWSKPSQNYNCFPPPGACNFSVVETADQVAEYSSRGPLTGTVPYAWTRTGVNIVAPSRQMAPGQAGSACNSPPLFCPCTTCWITVESCSKTEIHTALIDASYNFAPAPPVCPPMPAWPPVRRPPRLFSGTTAAVPHVAGTAALVIQADPTITALEVRAIVLNEADDRIVQVVNPAPAGPNDYGLGRVETARSVIAALEGRSHRGSITAAGFQDSAISLSADHEAEVTLAWDRMDGSLPTASQLDLQVFQGSPPAGGPLPNTSGIAPGINADDNYRHYRFRTTVAGPHTIRVVPTLLRPGPDSEEVPYAYAWGSVPAPIDGSGPAVYLPVSNVMAGSPPTPAGNTYPAVADFDGDTDQDIAANVGGSFAVWWRNDAGAFNFANAASPTGFSGGTSLLVGTVNGDSYADIVAGDPAVSRAFSGLGAAGSPFPTTVTSSLAAPFDPNVHAIDLLQLSPRQTDPFVDLALVNNPSATASDFLVFFGTGTGTFLSSPPQVSLGGYQLMGTAAGDFDGDGDVDVVGLGVRLGAIGAGTPADLPRQAGVISLFRNDGFGSFAPPDTATGAGLSYFPELATPAISAAALSVGDYDLDGKLDLAVASQRRFDPQNPVRVVILAGNGAGEFARIGEAPCWTEIPGNPLPQPVLIRDAVSADVDGDGRKDMALLLDQGIVSFLRVFRMGSSGRPERREGYPIAAQLGVPTSLATGGNLLGASHEEVAIGGVPSGASVQV